MQTFESYREAGALFSARRSQVIRAGDTNEVLEQQKLF